MTLVIRRRAAFAVAEIFARYESEQPGLGLEFMGCFEAACAAIEREPFAAAPHYRDFRRRNLRRFPYTLHYLVAGGNIIVSLIFHASRDPNELYSRLEDDGP